ncbi:unnamed protein product, partial [Prunus brigantina]
MARSAVCGAAFIVVLLCVLMTTPYVINATVTCSQVVTLLTPCIPFGVYGGTVPPECCAGIKGLHDAQNTAEDRRTACSCIQQGAAMIPGIDYDRINTLGDRCGSPCPYKVYPSTNCSELYFGSLHAYPLEFLEAQCHQIVAKGSKRSMLHRTPVWPIEELHAIAFKKGLLGSLGLIMTELTLLVMFVALPVLTKFTLLLIAL